MGSAREGTDRCKVPLSTAAEVVWRRLLKKASASRTARGRPLARNRMMVRDECTVSYGESRWYRGS